VPGAAMTHRVARGTAAIPRDRVVTGVLAVWAAAPALAFRTTSPLPASSGS